MVVNMNPQIIPTNRYNLTPPLRLVLTTQCNGRCEYCHHEGEISDKDLMDKSTVLNCAKIAENLSIPTVTLTGGEPTMYPELPTLINDIQHIYHSNINLTTNGFNLQSVCESIVLPLHTINLSISSFNENVYYKYQNVDPINALKILNEFPATNKNVNIVITQDNYLEIKNILSFCIENSISLDIMFELKEYTPLEIKIQQYVLTKISHLGKFLIQFRPTPTFVINLNESCKISVKHPKLSKLLNRSICSTCECSSDCLERVCAVRIYPNGVVSPCLNQHIKFENGDLFERVKKAYDLLRIDTSELIMLLC